MTTLLDVLELAATFGCAPLLLLGLILAFPGNLRGDKREDES